MPIRKPFFPALLLCGGVLALLPVAATAQRVIHFADLALPPESFYAGADSAGGFSSGGAFFNNHYNPTYASWGGWAYSNMTDTQTAGWENQFSAITGAGISPNGIYAVAYMDTYTPALPRIVLPAGESVLGIQVTNTTYVYHSFLTDDGFSKKFGGADGNDPDFFLLTITGLSETETPTGSVEFFLADYRFQDNDLNYILDTWSWVDLSGLGAETRILEFTLSSSDNGIFGMNTPAYFAMGEMTVIPEPKTVALWTGLTVFLVIAGLRRRHRKPHSRAEAF